MKMYITPLVLKKILNKVEKEEILVEYEYIVTKYKNISFINKDELLERIYRDDIYFKSMKIVDGFVIIYLMFENL